MYLHEAQMKLEYLAAVSADCPLLRLYEFSSFDVAQLHDTIATAVIGFR